MQEHLLEIRITRPGRVTGQYIPVDAGALRLETIFNLVANAAGQSADHMDGFFNILRKELAFYIGCLNLSEQLACLGELICFPVPTDERLHVCSGMQTAVFLRADRTEGGHRTYKLIEAPPLKTSYGTDAYNKIFGGQP